MLPAKQKGKYNWKAFFSWMAVAGWMAVIFYLSHQPAEDSRALSRGVTEMVIVFLEGILPDTDLDIRELNYYVRKNAHFIAYFILAVLSMNAFGRSGVAGRRRIVFTMILCVFYAITDEIHQLFIPGRAGQVRDVLIDSAGSATGIAIYTVIRNVGRGRSNFRHL